LQLGDTSKKSKAIDTLQADNTLHPGDSAQKTAKFNGQETLTCCVRGPIQVSFGIEWAQADLNVGPRT
jgi:hypothetical protein